LSVKVANGTRVQCDT
jgi:hypothetical protein